VKLFAFLVAGLAMAFNVQAGEVTQHSTVISGKFGRAGSTNRQPLSDSALRGLCEQGYTLAMFLYPGARDHVVTCGGGKQIRYMSKTGYSSPSGILAAAKAEMDRGGKVLVHCWYGVHAAKFVAASALHRFCGFSGDQAANYFVRGIPPGSLSQSRINELASKLRAQGSGGSVTGGCPSP
jgi:hypothetical protein